MYSFSLVCTSNTLEMLCVLVWFWYNFVCCRHAVWVHYTMRAKDKLHIAYHCEPFKTSFCLNGKTTNVAFYMTHTLHSVAFMRYFPLKVALTSVCIIKTIVSTAYSSIQLEFSKSFFSVSRAIYRIKSTDSEV